MPNKIERGLHLWSAVVGYRFVTAKRRSNTIRRNKAVADYRTPKCAYAFK
jgi:hypothetical protein